ncbi:MAG: sulfotransferase [Alphaproteobacteria bacterium]|nr:sulfotransferase [Alphaproteobacteria bacterium]
MSQVTVAKTDYNFAFRTANFFAGAAERIGLAPQVLDRDEVLAAARRRTGLDDFGDDAFLEPMAHIIDAANGAGLSPLARVIVRQAYVEASSTRLKLTQLRRDDPTLDQTRIERPIFVVGFPRTGTTVLQNLLSLDPDRRALEFWELTRPMPELDDPVADAQRRLRTTEQMLAVAYIASPEMKAVHEIKSTTPEECWPLFCPSFAVMNWDLGSGLSQYGDWLMGWDMAIAYREYKQLLQLLVRQRPADHLVLKCPEHLWFLDALLTVFPDACIAWTHRDPYKSIASYCSLISMQWRTMYGSFDPADVGRHIEERFLVGVDRAMAVRDRVGDGRFFDVNFSALVKDEQAVLDGFTSKFDLRRCDPDAVSDYLATKRGDARGQHKYDGGMYGLDADRIRERFAHYVQRFDIQTT